MTTPTRQKNTIVNAINQNIVRLKSYESEKLLVPCIRQAVSMFVQIADIPAIKQYSIATECSSVDEKYNSIPRILGYEPCVVQSWR